MYAGIFHYSIQRQKLADNDLPHCDLLVWCVSLGIRRRGWTYFDSGTDLTVTVHGRMLVTRREHDP